QQEGVRDLRKRVAEELAVEERFADVRPARRVEDDDDDDREENDRAGDRDSDVASAAEVAQDPRAAVAAARLRVCAHAATSAPSGRSWRRSRYCRRRAAWSS